jgi:hypothetical protein
MATDAIVNVSEDFLSGLSEEFAKAAEPLPKGGVPEGQYSARLQGVVPGQTQNGIKYLNLDFEIVGPDDSEVLGAPITIHRVLVKPQDFEMLKRTLRSMRVTSKDFSDALKELAEKIGSVWSITAKHSQDGLYCNFYVNRQVSE